MKGGAKNAFKRFWQEQVGEPDENGAYQYEEKSEKMKRKKKVLSQKSMDTEALGSELEGGDYSVRYRFTLPDNIPSSLMFKSKHAKAEPKAKVKYYMKAKVVSENDDMSMSHKAVLAVRERPEALQTNT